MTSRWQFSLRSGFLAIFWAAATFGLLRLLPFVLPTRLVNLLLIDNSQRAPFVLLAPATLLIAVSATTGAALGALGDKSRRFSASAAMLATTTASIYFAVMAWSIWTDHYLTMLYTAVVVAALCATWVRFRAPQFDGREV